MFDWNAERLQVVSDAMACVLLQVDCVILEEPEHLNW